MAPIHDILHSHSLQSIPASSSSRDLDNTAFEPNSGILTPFSSTADALIARLRLEAGLGVPTINLFLDVLKHPSFKSEELTIRDAAEIDTTVSLYRKDLQRERGRNTPVPKRTVQQKQMATISRELPYPVLECILDCIAKDQDLVDEPLQYQIPLVDVVERQRGECLRSMALVHRTWTGLSQQRLSERLVARTPSQLIRLLRSPLPGRHTQELIISLGDVWNHGYHFEGSDSPARPGDVEADLCNLLRRLPQLRKLTIKESGLREDMVLPMISTLSTLESLSWHCAHGYPSCDFSHLADALRVLPRLNSLEISGWSFHATSDVTGGSLLSPLSELRICVSPGDMQLTRVGWLLQALASDGRKTSLTLDITLIGTLSIEEVFRHFPGAQEALAKLDSLHLINKGGFVEFNLTQARFLLQACTSIRHLHIQGQTAPITEFIDILPLTIEELCFSWFDMWMSPWNLVERHIPDLVRSKRSSQLKKITIFNYEIPFYRAPVEENGEPVQHPCPNAQEACDESKIELDLWSKPPDWRNV